MESWFLRRKTNAYGAYKLKPINGPHNVDIKSQLSYSESDRKENETEEHGSNETTKKFFNI